MNKEWINDNTVTKYFDFSTFEDASMWMQRELDEKPNDWVIYNCGINRMEMEVGKYVWRTSISMGIGSISMDLFDNQLTGV